MSRPHVTLKLATSLDGRIATATGESRWITGPEARAEVQRMRVASDAVMVGMGTVRADDPLLTARPEIAPPRQPLRVVLDTHFSLPLDSKLAETVADAGVLVIGAAGAFPERQAALRAAGVEVAEAATGERGVDTVAALSFLGDRGVKALLVEGGGQLAASLVRAGLADRIEWIRAPIVLGADGRPAVGGLGFTHLADAPAFLRVAVRTLGPDLWETYERI